MFSSNSNLNSISPFLTSSNSSLFVHGLSPLLKRSFSVCFVLPRKSRARGKQGTCKLNREFFDHFLNVMYVATMYNTQDMCSDEDYSVCLDFLETGADKGTYKLSYRWGKRDLCQILRSPLHPCSGRRLQTPSEHKTIAHAITHAGVTSVY